MYADFAERNPLWNRNPAATGHLYEWDPESLYIREPPYFAPSITTAPSVEFLAARALAILDDSITKSHIVCEAKVSGIDPGTFQAHAETAKVNYQVSQALAGTEITLQATLAAGWR